MYNDNTLHIAVITDEGYVIPTITMLTSTRLFGIKISRHALYS